MVIAAVFGGALVLTFVILVAVVGKTSNIRRGHSSSDGSLVMFGDGGSGGCDSGSASDGGGGGD